MYIFVYYLIYIDRSKSYSNNIKNIDYFQRKSFNIYIFDNNMAFNYYLSYFKNGSINFLSF